MYINYINDTVKEHCKITNQELPTIKNAENALDKEIYQFLAYLDKENESILFNNIHDIEPHRAVPMCIDVAPANGGKTVGINEVLKYYNIPLEETIAFGDGKNDIGMLKHVQLGIAVGNSSDEVKENADYVSPNIEEDGIIKALIDLHIL